MIKKYRIDFWCTNPSKDCYTAENVIAVHQYPFESYGSFLEASFIRDDKECQISPRTYCYPLPLSLRERVVESFLQAQKLKDSVKNAKTY